MAAFLVVLQLTQAMAALAPGRERPQRVVFLGEVEVHHIMEAAKVEKVAALATSEFIILINTKGDTPDE